MHTDNLSEILLQHPFLAGLSKPYMETLIGCASNTRFNEGSYLIHEGQLANTFFMIRTGRVAVEIDVSPKGLLRVQTIGPGDVLGWSWLISPFRWHFSACAVAEVRAVALDGECLRNKCESDHDFGYEMMKRLAQVMERRLEATRLQLLDLYGTTNGVKS
ncbi:MAG TPA: cyclic nucleotide-binding domain-containing protein [Bacteroidota bacterium]|nr:cyclic nucleotide-binding domain-containing protein [Bacteroidota bacterium]